MAISESLGVFLAEVPNRNDWDAITLQIWDGRPGSKDQRPHVIMGGVERQFLPPGVQGVHGEGENKLLGSRNLISEALESDHVVLRTREEAASRTRCSCWLPTAMPAACRCGRCKGHLPKR
jgi:alkaline phosphatase